MYYDAAPCCLNKWVLWFDQVEIKNMNSFSAMQKAIEFEIDRQIALLEEGDKIKQETRLWEEGSQVSFDFLRLFVPIILVQLFFSVCD